MENKNVEEIVTTKYNGSHGSQRFSHLMILVLIIAKQFNLFVLCSRHQLQSRNIS